VAYFEILSHHFPGMTEDNRVILSLCSHPPVQDLTWDFLNFSGIRLS